MLSRDPVARAHTAAYDCQALAALRSMLWSIPSRMRIPNATRDRHAAKVTACPFS